MLERFINRCWRCFKWSLLIAVALGVFVAQFIYLRVDREIRRKVETMLSEAYPNLHVHVRSARLIEGEGIEIRGVAIRDPAGDGAFAELVTVDELFLACNTDLKELVAGAPKINRMVVRGATLRVIREADGTWSTSRLLPLPKPKCEGPSPPGTIEHASIELVDLTKNPPSTYWLRDVQLNISPGERLPTDSPDEPPPKRITVQGSLAADFVQRIDVAGEIDLTHGTWFTSGKVSGLEACPELAASLPEPISCKLAGCGAVRGRANVEYRVAHDPEWPEGYRFEVQAHVSRGRADDPRLPFPISDLEGTVLVDQTGVTVRDVQAKSGDTDLRFSGRWEGFSPDNAGAMRLTARGLPLDSRLRALLPGKAEELWYQYLPAGTVNVELDLTHDPAAQGARWRPHGVVELENASVSYFKFPYRLERIRGRLVLKDRLLLIEATGQAANQPVTIKGHVQNPGPEAQIELYLAGDQIPGDEKLWRALPEKPAQVLRSLTPGGLFKVDARFRREAGLGQPVEQHIHLTVQEGSVNFKHFPYPITGIRGTIEGRGRSWNPTVGRPAEWNWRFSDLTGTNSGGEIQCSGTFGPGERGNELQFLLTGRNVPLDEELRGALRPREQKLWDQIRPLGFINLSSTVRIVSGAPAEVAIDVFPLDASIEPTAFPYRMEKLAGTIQIEKGQMRMSQMRGRHGTVALSARGECETTPEGAWKLKLSDISAERLRPDRDRELFQALPAKLRNLLATLRLTGPINLRGELEFEGAEGQGLRSTQWNLGLQLQRCELDSGVKLSNVYGGLNLTGRYDEKGVVSQGELDLDSLEYKDFQFTEVRGPIWMDEKQVIFGSLDGLRRKTGRDTPGQRHLVAKVVGGTIYGDGMVVLGASPEYHLQARLVDADLGRYAREMMPGKQTHLSGRVLGSLELHGAGAHTLRGDGTIALREADIYEFPIMVSMLSILSLRPPEATAFTESDIEFRIVGDYIQFKQIDFRGDAVSLRGTGSMNMNTELQLAFHAVVGRDEIRIPVVNKVVGRAAQQLMQIQITGTLASPVTDRKLVPGLQAMLNELKGPPSNPGVVRPTNPAAKN